MRKSHFWLIVAVAMLLAAGVGATVAYLVSSSHTVQNTFTVGNVRITLTETTGRDYQLVPGQQIKKDPVVTVLENSEDCWVFVKLEKANDFDTYCSYELREGWTPLAEVPDVFYQKVEKTGEKQKLSLLKEDSILIYDRITEEQLNAITEKPTLRVTAYAIQSEGFATAYEGWQGLHQ